MNITYKTLNPCDIPALTPIMKAAFDEDTRIHTELMEDGPCGYDTGELLEQMLRMKGSVSKVILCEDQIVGEYTIRKEENTYTLELLFIDPACSSKGIGSAVWQDIEQEYHDAETWLVETPAYSVRNHRFYQKCGFQLQEERVYSEGEKSFIFIKHVSFQIRELRDSDFEAIYILNRDEMGYDYPLDATTEKLQRLMNSSADKIYVAIVDGQVAGYVHANDYDTIYAPHMKNIMGIAVSSCHKRKGIGRALLTEVESWAKQTGANGVRLVSGSSRTAAHSFYRSCGYTENKTQLNFSKTVY